MAIFTLKRTSSKLLALMMFVYLFGFLFGLALRLDHFSRRSYSPPYIDDLKDFHGTIYITAAESNVLTAIFVAAMILTLAALVAIQIERKE